jgi:hypothetical protein
MKVWLDDPEHQEILWFEGTQQGSPLAVKNRTQSIDQ